MTTAPELAKIIEGENEPDSAPDAKYIKNAKYIETYIDGIKNSYPVRKSLVLWSFLSLFYICSGLELNIVSTAEGGRGIATPWGIPIIGIEDSTLLYLMLILVGYKSICWVYIFIRLHYALKFDHEYKDHECRNGLWTVFQLFRSELGLRRRKRQLNQKEKEGTVEQEDIHDHWGGQVWLETVKRSLEDDHKKDKAHASSVTASERVTVVCHEPLLGKLEYFLVPIIVPFVLSSSAVIAIIYRLV